MQLFKDRKLRREFEEFKRDTIKKFKKLEKENALLEKENASLKEECAIINKELVKLHNSKVPKSKGVTVELTESKPQKTKKVKKAKKPKKESSPVFFGGASINKYEQRKYASLSFDGFWFKPKRGKSANKNICNVHQVICLKGLQNETDVSWAELSRAFGIKPKTVQKIAFNIMEGTFDKYISQYYNTKFSFKKGELCINGKPTGLTSSDVQEIVFYYVNNKSEKIIDKLIKMHPKIKSDYIITICDNHDSIRLKKHVGSVKFENNPQKRKEKGMS